MKRALQPPFVGLLEKLVKAEKWDATQQQKAVNRQLRTMIVFGVVWIAQGLMYVFARSPEPVFGSLFVVLGLLTIGVSAYRMRSATSRKPHASNMVGN
jgi:hypothetical protein